MFYDSDVSESLKLPNSVCAKYISDPDSIFRFVSIDNLKRNSASAATSVVLHSSASFGVEHVEKTPDQVKPILEAEALKLFPNWPKADHVKCQKWRFSQVCTL